MNHAQRPERITAAQPALEPVNGDDMPLHEALAALQQAGADRLDPVQWHYLQALATRMAQQDARVQTLLQPKLHAALAALRKRMQHGAQQGMPTAGLQGAIVEPAGKADGANAAIVPSAPARSPLAALTQYLSQQSQAIETQARSGLESVGTATGSSLRPELKAVRQFRNTWSKLSADQQLNRALEQAPHNAGPINSHMLVLRSLALMRDISPDYLNRFMSYADALLCLDQPLQEPAMATKATGAVAKKARTPRAKPPSGKPR